MKKHKLIVNIPTTLVYVDYVDHEGACYITMKEGEMPITPPTYTVEEEEDD